MTNEKTTELSAELTAVLTLDGQFRPESQAIMDRLQVPAQPSPEKLEAVLHCIGLLEAGTELEQALTETWQLFNEEKPQASVAIAKSEPSTPDTVHIPETNQAGIKDVAGALVPEVDDINTTMAQSAMRVNGTLNQICDQAMVEAVFGEDSPNKPDPAKAVEIFRKLKRGESV